MLCAWHVDRAVLEALQTMLQHRSVDLLQNVETHLDFKIRRDADDVGVECSVVQLAEREPIGNHRLSQRMAVWQNMRRLEQFVMAEAANGAALLIGAQNALTEATLV